MPPGRFRMSWKLKMLEPEHRIIIDIVGAAVAKFSIANCSLTPFLSSSVCHDMALVAHARPESWTAVQYHGRVASSDAFLSSLCYLHGQHAISARTVYVGCCKFIVHSRLHTMSVNSQRRRSVVALYTSRASRLSEFNTNEACRVLLVSITAGGQGLDFTAASNVVFVELPESPAWLRQAEDRLHRRNQVCCGCGPKRYE